MQVANELEVYEAKTPNKKLTEKEEKFLEVLMEEAQGDFKVAKHLAGYAPQQNLASIVKRLKHEILEVSQLYLAKNIPVAISVLLKIATEEEAVPDARNKIAAALAILDRAGLTKTVKTEISHKQEDRGLVVLPPKED